MTGECQSLSMRTMKWKLRACSNGSNRLVYVTAVVIIALIANFDLSSIVKLFLKTISNLVQPTK